MQLQVGISRWKFLQWAEVSYVHGRSEHVHHSLLYIPSVHRGVTRMCVLSPGSERGSRQADRAPDRDWYIYL